MVYGSMGELPGICATTMTALEFHPSERNDWCIQPLFRGKPAEYFAELFVITIGKQVEEIATKG